jgi:G3E family GTPase
MFLKWSTDEDCATSAAIILLTLAGLTIIMIDHQTKARQKRLAATLTQGFWKFTPTQVDDWKQRKLNWMKLLLAGMMLSCTTMSITVKYLKVTKALVLCTTIFIGWVTFLTAALAKKPMKVKVTADTEVDTSGWKAKLKGSVSTEDKRLPVTIVTGFLGSGKTTLVKKVLDNTAGIRVLVIENEVGAEGIDHDLLLQHTGKEEIILMNNGCICCTVRKDLIKTFHDMFADPSFSKLDWVLIETTGLADPAPLIQSLYMDVECSKYLRLDCVLTVVDAKHLSYHIGNKEGDGGDSRVDGSKSQGDSLSGVRAGVRTGVHGGIPEAAMQIIFSDRIILNKVDLVTEDALIATEDVIRSLNHTAQIIRCEYSNVPVQDLLNIRAFDPSRNSALISSNSSKNKGKDTAKDGSSLNGEVDRSDVKNVAKGGFIRYDGDGKIISSKIKLGVGSGESNDPNIVSTISLVTTKPLNLDMFNLWIAALLRIEGANIFRLKGILNMYGYDNQFVVQGVHMIFDGEVGPPWNDADSHGKVVVTDRTHAAEEQSDSHPHSNGSRRSRLVLIGVGLNATSLNAAFLGCEHVIEEDEK